MDKQAKNQLVLLGALVVVMILTAIGCFALAGHGVFGVKINWFSVIYEVTKNGIITAYALIKLFVLAIWGVVFNSWLSALVTLGLIMIGVLAEIYNQRYN